MKLYILGICGTFMAGLALIARELGHAVEGSDAKVYPPMSTQLADAGIRVHDGYDAASLPADSDLFVIGNAITRGNAQFEAILERGYRYTSGPQWLSEQVLHGRWVLAVAGTHGKTTTSSMLAWILEYAGLEPGFLIGGRPGNFAASARLGKQPFFVIEADEYDSALFDKRSKFVHYHPRTLILNNLEFDHADIFDDLAAIKRQFHHLVRTLPASALIVSNADDPALDDVIDMGCWSELCRLSTRDADADAWLDADAGLHLRGDDRVHRIEIAQPGQFNRVNAAAAVVAARHAGVAVDTSLAALAEYEGVRRRQELIAEVGGVRVIDDFAHHPTAIALTLEALRPATTGRLIAVVDIRSNTMKMGVHAGELGRSFAAADLVLLCETPGITWDIAKMAQTAPTIVEIKADAQQIVDTLSQHCQPGDQIVIMSNGGFDNIHQRLVQALPA